jgi:hypothetical protein
VPGETLSLPSRCNNTARRAFAAKNACPAKFAVSRQKVPGKNKVKAMLKSIKT